jgi:hypothetical protein
VPIGLLFETHSTTVDNERGRAAGWLPGQVSEQASGMSSPGGAWTTSSTVCCSKIFLEQGFSWQEGWEYRIS